MEQPSNNKPNVPPLLPGNQQQASGAPPRITGTSSARNEKSSSVRQGLAILLSLCLGLFIAEAIVALVDSSLILLFDLHILAGLRGILFFVVILMELTIYGLMGLTPMIPKRWFFPVALFIPVATLLMIPLLFYFKGQTHQIALVFSLCQLLLGLAILYKILGGFHFRWPIVKVEQLTSRGFSWRNLVLFVALNLFVLLPAAVGYLAFSAASAVDHFSDGFMALRPSGFTVQARKYVREDGKTIHLYPMAHIGDAGFYQKLSRSFPTNSIILMEGVMDRNNLLTNKVTYKRMATSLGLADQQKEFKPTEGESVMADVDVEQFAPSTIDLLNLVMLIHSKGLTPENVIMLSQYSPSPGEEKQLFDDILSKRNQHLLGEIESHLPRTENIVVPWGAAHMPEIARELQKSGFHLKETEDFVVVRFGSDRKP